MIIAQAILIYAAIPDKEIDPNFIVYLLFKNYVLLRLPSSSAAPGSSSGSPP